MQTSTGVVDHFTPVFGLDDRNVLSPGVEVPIHFQPSAGAEFHGQSAVLVSDGFLFGVKDVLRRFVGDVGIKPPFDIKRRFVIRAERFLRVFPQIEIFIHNERFRQDFNGFNVVQNETARLAVIIFSRVAGNQVMLSFPVQKAVGFDCAAAGFSG